MDLCDWAPLLADENCVGPLVGSHWLCVAGHPDSEVEVCGREPIGPAAISSQRVRCSESTTLHGGWQGVRALEGLPHIKDPRGHFGKYLRISCLVLLYVHTLSEGQ